MFRVRSIVLGLAAVPLLVSAAPRVAAAQATAQTSHLTMTGVEPGANPCSGAPGTFTFDAKVVLHTTADSAGGYHVTLTGTSDDLFVPSDSSQPTFSGRDTLHQDEQTLGGGSTSTFVQSGRLTSADGSSIRFWSLYHVTFNADGTPTATHSTDSIRCS